MRLHGQAHAFTWTGAYVYMAGAYVYINYNNKKILKPGRAGPVRKIDFRAPGAKINFGKSRAGPARFAKLIFAPRARKSILVKAGPGRSGPQN